MRNVPTRLRLFQLCAFAVVLAFNVPSQSGEAVSSEKHARVAAIADASRIVSIGGSVTEILYALGMQQKIVAVDTTSLYPASALQEKPNVGYMRQLSPEGVLGLAPTLIMAIEGSGPKDTIDVLGRANVPFVVVPDTFTGDGIVDKIRMISRRVGVPERGACLANPVRQDMVALAALRENIHQKVRVAFVLSLANGRPMISGHGTAADAIIQMAGGNNAFYEFEGYKPVNDEAIVAAKPDTVLVMKRGEHALSPDVVFSQPALAMTPAAEHKTLISMDGLYLLGFGPRTARAARDLATSLYPNINGGVLPSERISGPVPCDQ
jgi:iron complex transport system substrate-binding protein